MLGRSAALYSVSKRDVERVNRVKLTNYVKLTVKLTE